MLVNLGIIYQLINTSFQQTTVTDETYGNAVSMPSQSIELTENITAEQTSEVLSQVATYFEELADYVNEFNVIINMTVGWILKY